MSVVLSEHLPLLTSAPSGIQKLRCLILELAVRGKLAPQDPKDEPASELLKRIGEERALGIGTTRSKNNHAMHPGKVEPPFSTPGSWVWARLGDMVEVLDGLRKPVTKSDRNPGPYPYYGASGVVDYVSDYLFDEDLVLVGEDGAKWRAGDRTAFAILGKTWVNNHAHVLRPNRGVLADSFLIHALVARDLQPFITGITVPKLNQAKLISIEIPIPPLAEQHRIVAKVDELMALCDRLEAEVGAGDTAHARLVDTLLSTLTQSTDADDLAANWRRFAEHFNTLFTTEASIDALKQSILQLAVMGKLVPQDANDGPAATTLSCLGKWAVGSGFPTAEQGILGAEVLFAKVSDMNLPENGRFITVANNTISRETAARLRVNVHPAGTVVFPKIGGAIATNKRRLLVKDTAIDNNCLGITPKEGVVPNWLFVLLSSIDFTEYQAGTSVPALAQGVLSDIPVRLPSEKEQHRIVAKVDELMSLCDRLKADLAEARTRQACLSATLIDAALEAV